MDSVGAWTPCPESWTRVGSSAPAPWRRRIGVLIVLLLSSAMGPHAMAHAEAPRCRAGISKETAERLFAVLNQRSGETDCTFEGVETDRTSLSARWSRGGTMLPAVRVVPRECAPESAVSAGPFAVDVPAALGETCPSVLPLIAAFRDRVAKETPAGRHGSLNDPLFRGARALFLAIAMVAVGLLVRGTIRLRPADLPWTIIGMATFSGALVLRAALPFSVGNWYAEVLPASGPPPWMRFGPGYFAFQSLLRDAGVWSARTLMLSQLLVGAAAVPLLLGVLRELRVGLDATAAALVLFIFAPFHARLSATSSEHVLASTLCLGLLLCWMRAARTRDGMWFTAALLLFPAVCATRIDMTLQASLVLLWPLLTDRAERDPGMHRWPPPWMGAVLALVALATVVAAYRLIVLPSQHPTPEWAAHLWALRYVAPQYWIMASNDPAWISLPSLLLALAGMLAMAARRPWLLVRLVGTLLLAFVALGRSFVHDELISARYFLFTIPIFLIASGYGFETLLALAPQRFRPLAAAGALACLAVWSGVSARSAYAARYAFEDEYAFARRALARLPAGCTVYQVPIRADALPRDVDCCLDIARSPLVLDFPTLQFFDLPEDPTLLLEESPCAAYYEGIACEIAPGRAGRFGPALAAKAAEYFQPGCAGVHRLGALELLAETTTSPRTTEDFFAAEPPRARLYRWNP